MLRAIVACCGLILAGFHVWLFGQQAWAGDLQYATALRWLLAVGLAGGLVALHRRRASVWDRRVTALWILALLLHGPALADGRGPTAQSLAETSEVAIQLAGATLGLGLAITIGRVSREWQPALDAGAALACLVPFAGPRDAAFGDGFLPRPPPIA